MSPLLGNMLTLILLCRSTKEEEESNAQVAEDNTLQPNVRDEEAGLDNSVQGSTAGRIKPGDGKHLSAPHIENKSIEKGS